jgi:hypothetical protein
VSDATSGSGYGDRVGAWGHSRRGFQLERHIHDVVAGSGAFEKIENASVSYLNAKSDGGIKAACIVACGDDHGARLALADGDG